MARLVVLAHVAAALVFLGNGAVRAASPPLYSSYLGGSGKETALGTTVDAQGNFFVTGSTASSNYPTSSGAAQTAYGGNTDAFFTKFGPAGNLVHSSYLGGSALDESRGVAVDSSGSVYVLGFTESADFPTLNARDEGLNGPRDIFLTKLSSAGSIVFSTYLGGSGTDSAMGLAVDSSGSAYVTGETDSTDFPITSGAFDATQNGDVDSYIAKFSPTGTLIYSTFLGSPGFDDGLALAVDGSGNAFATGKASPGFPVTPGAFDTTHNGGYDMFVTKLNPAGTALVYSTYVGGDSWDEGLGIAVDTAGSAYITGNVQSRNYPTTPGAYQPSFTGSMDASFTKLSPSGSALVYSTLFGGSTTAEGDGLAIDADGNAYIAGHLGSPDLPTTSNAFQTSFGGIIDGFVAKVDPTGSNLLYSSYVGGRGWDGAMTFSIDAGGNAYLSGSTGSTDFAVTSDAYQPRLGGDFDAFFTKLSTTTPAPPPPPPPSPPVNTAPPAISGTPEQGQTLTTSTGTWSNDPTSFAYQWQRCNSTGDACAAISGATTNTYVLTAADVGSTIRSTVTAANVGGSASATSAQTPSVAGVMTFTILASGDDGDVTVKGRTRDGYPPSGAAAPNANGSTMLAGRRNVTNQYQVSTVLVRFDTSTLPDNANVTSATLRLRVNAKADANNRNLLGEWYAGSNWPIDAADYSLNSTASAIAEADITAITTSAVNNFTLSGLTNVSKTGYTGLRLHVDGGAPTGDNYVQVASFDSSGVPKPQLVVRYALP